MKGWATWVAEAIYKLHKFLSKNTGNFVSLQDTRPHCKSPKETCPWQVTQGNLPMASHPKATHPNIYNQIKYCSQFIH